MMTATRLVWVKEGNHVNECHGICQQCATETGDDHAGEPDVELLRIRDEVFTIVEAEGDWWEEYMTVHGWHGWPLDLWLDVFDWIPGHVGELRDFLRKLRTDIFALNFPVGSRNNSWPVCWWCCGWYNGGVGIAT